MSKRRSLDDALITPEEKSFMETGVAAPERPVPIEPTKLETAPVPPQPQPEAVKLDVPANTIAPPADGGLVSLNVRIEPSITASLLRASMERKIQRIEPHTQRDIVSEALAVWLKANGYA